MNVALNEQEGANYHPRPSKDPFQLELFDAVKKQQYRVQRGGGENGNAHGMLLDDDDGNTMKDARQSQELDFKMSTFPASKQSPYKSPYTTSIEGNSEKRPLNSSPGTSCITNKHSNKQQQNSEYISSKPIDTSPDNDVESNDKDDVFDSHEQKDMNERNNRPARPGLVKRPAFSENLENDALAPKPEEKKFTNNVQNIEDMAIERHQRNENEIVKSLSTNKKKKPSKTTRHIVHSDSESEDINPDNDDIVDPVLETENYHLNKTSNLEEQNKFRRRLSKSRQNTKSSISEGSVINNDESIIKKGKKETRKQIERNEEHLNKIHRKEKHFENNKLKNHSLDLEQNLPSGNTHGKESHFGLVNSKDNLRLRNDMVSNSIDTERHHLRPGRSRKEKEIGQQQSITNKDTSKQSRKQLLSSGMVEISDEEDVYSTYSESEDEPERQLFDNDNLDSIFKNNLNKGRAEKLSDDYQQTRHHKSDGKSMPKKSFSSGKSVYNEDDMIGRTKEKKINDESEIPNQSYEKSLSSKHRRAASLGSTKQHSNEAVIQNDKGYIAYGNSKLRLQTGTSESHKQTDELGSNDEHLNQYRLRKSGSLGSMLHEHEQKNEMDESIVMKYDRDNDRKRDKRYSMQLEKDKNIATTPDKPSGFSRTRDNTSKKMQHTEGKSSQIGKYGRKSALAEDTRLATAEEKKGKMIEQLPRKGPIKANVDISAARSAAKKIPEKTHSKQKDAKGMIGKRSLSFTNISNIRPKLMHQTSEHEEEHKRILDSTSLRDQIYYDWLQNKTELTKTQLIAKKEKERQMKEEAERENKDKNVMAKKAFEAWQMKKDEDAKQKQVLIAQKKKQEKEKSDELKQKKMESEKYFNSWKTQKDECLIESYRKKKEEEKEKEHQDRQEKKEKTHSAKKVFENWKAKKDELLKDKVQEMRTQVKTQRLAEYEKREKKKKAEKMFQQWKEEKQRSPRQDEPALVQRAWCPSSRNSGHAIPGHVKPVIHRNPPSRSRTLSGTVRQ